MGFDCSLFVAPKYNDTTIKEIDMILRFHTFDTNEWAQKNFTTAEEYCVYDKKDAVVPSQDKLDFYKSFIHKDEYGYNTIDDNIASWCSNGAPIFEYIGELLGVNLYDGYVKLERKHLEHLLDWAWGKIDSLMPTPVYISKAYTEIISDDEEEIVGYKSFNIDGIEVIDEETNMFKRVYCDKESPVLMNLYGWEFEEYYYAYYNLIRGIEKIFMNYDLDKYDVYFGGGW